MLLETVCKAMVKVVNKQLSHIISDNNILKGGNFAGIPGGSTLAPLRTLNLLIEDAKENNKEIWVLFQDLSKAYDRVNGYMLDRAMEHIRIPPRCRDFILSLFTNRFNRVITHAELTDPYEVLIGIDQGEVISPLFWTIYYDPLLCEINSIPDIGYSLSHTWRPDLSLPSSCTSSSRVSTLAYMDDTTYIGSSKVHIDIMLNISNEFNAFNNVLTNDLKSVLLSSCACISPASSASANSTSAMPITFTVNDSNFELTPKLTFESTRFLGVWINLDLLTNFVQDQIATEITQCCNTLKYKQLTDKQLQYIFNRVISTRIEYRSQLVIFSPTIVRSLFSPFRKLFKWKVHLSSTSPNYVLDCSHLYNVISFHDLQLRSHISKFVLQLNHPSRLSALTRIHLHQLQSSAWLPSSPLVHWPYPLSKRFSKNLLARTLSLMNEHQFTFLPTNLNHNTILGCNFPLHEILKSVYFLPKTLTSLRSHSIMFLSQLTSAQGDHLLPWTALNDLSVSQATLTKFGKQPFWHHQLESIVLAHPLTSRQVRLQFTTGIDKSFLTYIRNPDTSRLAKKDWVSVWNDEINQAVLGRICIKDTLQASIILEHWIHHIDNDTLSPTYNKPLVTRCPGCQINNASYNIQPTRSYGIRYLDTSAPAYFLCTSKYYAVSALVIPRIKRVNTDTYNLVSSITELKQRAEVLYQSLSNAISPPIIRDIPGSDDPILRHVSSAYTQTGLLYIKRFLSASRSLTFYTDGSVRKLRTRECSVGIGWVQTDPSAPHIEFSASTIRFPSSVKAEFYAAISALCVAPNHATVHIVSDCQTVVTCLNAVAVSPSSLVCPISRDFTLCWLALCFIVQTSSLTLLVTKVRAHSDVPQNDLADNLAKLGHTCPAFDFDFSFLPDTYHILSWSSIPIEIYPRKFLRHYTQAITFNRFYSAHRHSNFQVNVTRNVINWPLSHVICALNNCVDTSFINSRLRSFQIKCAVEELPTIRILKLRRPDLYNHNWKCCSCEIEEESFPHIWLCSSRTETMHNTISAVRLHLLQQINLYLPLPLADGSPSATALFNAPFWCLNASRSSFSFIDMIKGLIPQCLVDLLTSFSLSHNHIQTILLSTFSFISSSVFTNIWIPRCQDVIKLEQFFGITKMKKCTGLCKVSHAATRSQFPTINYDPIRVSAHSGSVTNEQWYTWVNDACHYGESYQDFCMHRDMSSYVLAPLVVTI